MSLPFTPEQVKSFALQHKISAMQATRILAMIARDRAQKAATAHAAAIEAESRAKRAALIADAQRRHAETQKARFLAIVREIGAEQAGQWLSEMNAA